MIEFFQEEIINFILGVITGIVGTVAYNKLHSICKKIKREK